ncbi:hypothetical protein ACH5RR_021134 [Cinchona calisaya]|uniref:AB hydrolase-1 domain-containing protein n=1 Tax=Cinchona calisaya TaxID=153742 RepID=A0ABD2ZJQ3_9GENT
MYGKIAVAVVVGLVGWIYKSLKPPPPKICGRPGGPPVTTPRFRLRDGRYLSYKVRGVPVEEAKHKIIVFHGFNGSKDMDLPYPQELIEELKVCFVTFDRPGYGESDPNPNRGPKAEAQDVEELADHLNLGSRFYIIGLSVGGYVAWSCLMYIPHRLAGASLVVPFCNYFWPGLPTKVLNKAFKRLPVRDQWSFRIAHHFPWLFYWFATQKWIPTFKLEVKEGMFTKRDLEVLATFAAQNPDDSKLVPKPTQQGEFYCLHQDLLCGYGKWEMGPLDIKNPFRNNEGRVHIWVGGEDRVIPADVLRYIAEKLPWIKYHELAGKGHFFFHYPELCEEFLREILSE